MILRAYVSTEESTRVKSHLEERVAMHLTSAQEYHGPSKRMMLIYVKERQALRT